MRPRSQSVSFGLMKPLYLNEFEHLRETWQRGGLCVRIKIRNVCSRDLNLLNTKVSNLLF